MAYGAILGQTVEIPQPVDTVASGNMNAVTSNAVYQTLQNLPAGAKIVTGSYAGTGKYGQNNPNSLSAPSPIQFVFVWMEQNNVGVFNRGTAKQMIGCYDLTTEYKQYCGLASTNLTYTYGKVSEDRCTYYWYNIDDAFEQLNETEYKYWYILFCQ